MVKKKRNNKTKQELVRKMQKKESDKYFYENKYKNLGYKEIPYSKIKEKLTKKELHLFLSLNLIKNHFITLGDLNINLEKSLEDESKDDVFDGLKNERQLFMLRLLSSQIYESLIFFRNYKKQIWTIKNLDEIKEIGGSKDATKFFPFILKVIDIKDSEWKERSNELLEIDKTFGNKAVRFFEFIYHSRNATFHFGNKLDCGFEKFFNDKKIKKKVNNPCFIKIDEMSEKNQPLFINNVFYHQYHEKFTTEKEQENLNMEISFFFILMSKVCDILIEELFKKIDG